MLTRYALFVGIILCLSGLLAACGRSAAPTPAPAIAALPSQPAPAASATPSPAPSPTEAPTATPSATPTETPIPTPPATATPAPSPTPPPTEAPKPTATKEVAVIPESLFPRYGVFEGSLVDGNGKNAGRMVLMRLPGQTPASDKYAKCMFTKEEGGWVGCDFITLGEGEGGAYSQIYPPARRVISLVFEKGSMVSGRVVRPMGVGVKNELGFSLTGRGDKGEILKGKESVIVVVRRFIEKGFGEGRGDVYSDSYIRKFLGGYDIILP